ncbi:rod shape-determining protein MreC [Kribbella sp. NBC_01245]|uniref:rod shape-determining protein MreC n=1 Tax=Kribbella sp. NBC_01245 TaxID=2903578 RepID=UPI002E2DB440|nr:rod shape-determining protein MreC [Kribbella sp. NBC_01245]
MLKDLGAPPTRGVVRSAGLPKDIRRRRTVLALVVLASLTLMILDARRSAGSPVDPLRDTAAGIFGPLQSSATSARKPVDDLKAKFAAAERLTAENERLREENRKLTSQLRSTDYARKRAVELDKLLRVASNVGYKIAPARVIAIGPAQSFSQTITIDAGAADGVRADMTVLNGDGLIGRVVRATASTATVLLIGDRGSTVGGRLDTTQALGFVTGRGELGSHATLEYRLVDLKARPRVGAKVMTWGSSGNAPYVAGVPIGVITSVGPATGTLGSTALIRPYADAGRIDTVGVVVGPTARSSRRPLPGPR